MKIRLPHPVASTEFEINSNFKVQEDEANGITDAKEKGELVKKFFHEFSRDHDSARSNHKSGRFLMNEYIIIISDVANKTRTATIQLQDVLPCI